MNPQKLISYYNSAGWPFIGLFAFVTFGLAFTTPILFWLGVVLTAWCFYFFRDPERVTPARSGLIVSPADGKVVAVQEVVPDHDLGLGAEPRTRISIFLNVFDVHVNRIPADGIVRSRLYRPGAFVNASLDKASVDNERMALVIQLAGEHPYNNKELGVVQIAGLIARRIICGAQEGQTFTAGERYGIIRFGSRADIYLPPGLPSMVAVGQYMLGGETILADCMASEPARQGVIRK
jgi:phosphatidylserine decarboxylase